MLSGLMVDRYIVMMKPQKSSFMVEDILGLKSIDVSHFKQERVGETCKEGMLVEGEEKKLSKSISSKTKGKFILH